MRGPITALFTALLNITDPSPAFERAFVDGWSVFYGRTPVVALARDVIPNAVAAVIDLAAVRP